MSQPVRRQEADRLYLTRRKVLSGQRRRDEELANASKEIRGYGIRNCRNQSDLQLLL